jgi:hypothetical protein
MMGGIYQECVADAKPDIPRAKGDACGTVE